MYHYLFNGLIVSFFVIIVSKKSPGLFSDWKLFKSTNDLISPNFFTSWLSILWGLYMIWGIFNYIMFMYCMFNEIK